MTEAVAIIALLLVARRLRRAARAPQSITVHVVRHFPAGGPGERQPEDVFVLDQAVGSNVIPLRASHSTRELTLVELRGDTNPTSAGGAAGRQR